MHQNIENVLRSRLTTIAILAAQQGGELLTKAFGTAYTITSKEGRHNLVTEYDQKVEELIIKFIKKHFPDHGFLAEEGTSSEKASTEGIQWVIDPIDGTVNFAHNIPFFCVSIAACFQGSPLSGVVYNPMTHELFVAEKNLGAYLNGNPLQVSKVALLPDAILATGFPYNAHQNPSGCIDHFIKFARLGVPIRRLGSAALDLAYVAAGRFDGFWEVSLHPWDFAAGKLLIEEAGGLVTNYQKQDIFSSDDPTTLIASNSLLHDQMLNHLKPVTS
jgi:myo-inositol-1(or 4)-monophosphatase